ncbi:MAG: alpha-1,4-glucan--maltose-1-phosphate maltosyltransferase [Verrucomicrobia bacterium]|nr:alpha-1,4-glucan--maltose-1-phosphate maltosyltransferase [Verrucomicrobiota bacterium]
MAKAKQTNKANRFAGRERVVIENVKPQIDEGRFPIKRTIGEKVLVEADVFVDGHDALSCVLLFRHEKNPQWSEVPMEFIGNDRWRAEFTVAELGRYHYALQGWVDHFKSWQRDLRKRVEAQQQDMATDLLVGAELVFQAAGRASGQDAHRLKELAASLRNRRDFSGTTHLAMVDDLAPLVVQYSERRFATLFDHELGVIVDPVKARFSAWYEMFPRSCSAPPGQHGTFKDCEARLPYVAAMGFDVLYFPPIHPIGRTHRKGKNNALTAGPDDVGSPWAIGAEEGGYKAIHPHLGTLEDFRTLVAKAKELGIDIALDTAFQCSPDHPYVREHPEWFKKRPDGTIQYAENPPKKYQDIYPFDFETEHWQALWDELTSVVLFWAEQGVRIFRVDNPHTKPFRFWDYLLEKVKARYPEAIFLSEAFTRPKVRYGLTKLGFSQAYTYFAWRNTKWELTTYLTELTQTDVREHFRPNLWPNTPDILTEHLQNGEPPIFSSRLILAATLSANYGIYGPAYELRENRARERRSEEYLDSEKYQLRRWDLDRPDSLKELIGRVNKIRRENPALQSNGSLRFHPCDNDQILCYSKHTEDYSNLIVVVVNLDSRHTQAGWVELPIHEMGVDPEKPYQMHDLLTDARYMWHGPRNYVELNPHFLPAHILRVRRRVRAEQDFDYYM